MIPVQLTIQGLYSYQEKQTIDFTRLTSASLFGIFGTVGSGKSSVLEAITFALYGRTSRLNLAGDNRYYNMMNLKSDQLFIEFIFETGKDQTACRSVVRGKRNSKKFDDVRALDRFAYKKIDGEWKPVDTAELEQAVGLSYDNFRRTIIIPQGQFQEFLQLGNKDRTQMMKELFNLGKYEFYFKVASLESKNNALKQKIEGQLHQLGEIDEKQVTSHQQQLARLNKELEELEGKLKDYLQQADELKQLRELTVNLAETEKHLYRLQEQEPEFRKLEKTIVRYEQCVDRFKHLLSSLDECTARIGIKENRIHLEEKKLADLKMAIAEKEQQREDIKPAYEKREDTRQQALELGILIRIREMQSSIDKNRERLTKGRTVVEQTKLKIDEIRKNKVSIESLIKTNKQNLPDTTVLANAKAWHVENDGLNSQSDEIKLQINKYNRETTELEEKLYTVLSGPSFIQLKEKTDLPSVLQHLSNSNMLLKEQLDALQQDADELGVKARLREYAVELKDGKACPLCGSIEHPKMYTVEDLKESQNRIKELKDVKEKNLEKNRKLEIQLNDLHSRMNSGRSLLNEWKGKDEELQRKMKRHQELFDWGKYRSKEALHEAFSEADKMQAFIKIKEAELDELGNSLEKELRNQELYQAELDKLKELVTIGQAQADTLQEQLKVISPEDYHSNTTAELAEKKDELLGTCRLLEEKYESLTKLLEEHRNNVYNLTGSLDAQRKELLQEKEALQGYVNRVDEELKNNGYHEIDEVRKVLALPLALEQEKKKLADFRQQQALLAQRYRQLQTEISSRSYDAEVHEKLLGEIELCKIQLNEKNQEVGSLTGLIKKLQHDVEQKAGLMKEQQQLEMRAENIKTMKSLFKASGFVNYVSSVYLQNLCNAANDRFFQLTRQKLSLEITADNNFQVRDFMNGGKVRSVKTLSGGQTFQAALSLALALADNIQKITESNQNFFFLDEGFGSLDKESLAVVFDTLKTLRKENRIVGVISHVEEMQQEIDVHLQIEHQEDRGSIIHPSWAE